MRGVAKIWGEDVVLSGYGETIANAIRREEEKKGPRKKKKGEHIVEKFHGRGEKC